MPKMRLTAKETQSDEPDGNLEKDFESLQSMYNRVVAEAAQYKAVLEALSGDIQRGGFELDGLTAGQCRAMTFLIRMGLQGATV